MSSSIKLYQRQRPLREIVAGEIRSRIFSGELSPGTRLVERDLADLFSVSRLPVREALRALHEEGLTESIATRGLIVRTFDERQVNELFDIRQPLEALAASHAAERAGHEDIAHLIGFVTTSQDAAEVGDIDAAHLANLRFHDEIVKLSGNAVLQETLKPIAGRLHWLFRQVPDFTEVCVQHDALVSAIGSGDGTRAANVAGAHVAYYRRRTCEYLFSARTNMPPQTRPGRS